MPKQYMVFEGEIDGIKDIKMYSEAELKRAIEENGLFEGEIVYELKLVGVVETRKTTVLIGGKHGNDM